MDDCEIPKTIVKRSKELENFSEKLEEINDHFNELKRTDEDQGSTESKAAMRKFVDEISKRLYGFEEEKVELTEFQKSTLEAYGPKDFIDLNNAPIIV